MRGRRCHARSVIWMSRDRIGRRREEGALFMRDWLARQVNRAQRGKNWVASFNTGLIAFVAVRDAWFLEGVSNTLLFIVLVPGSMMIMWFVGWFDETRGIWRQQLEHKSGYIDPIKQDLYRHVIDIKQELGLEVRDNEKSRYMDP